MSNEQIIFGELTRDDMIDLLAACQMAMDCTDNDYARDKIKVVHDKLIRSVVSVETKHRREAANG